MLRLAYGLAYRRQRHHGHLSSQIVIWPEDRAAMPGRADNRPSPRAISADVPAEGDLRLSETCKLADAPDLQSFTYPNHASTITTSGLNLGLFLLGDNNRAPRFPRRKQRQTTQGRLPHTFGRGPVTTP
jgi:hypothetical protein